MTAHIYFQTLLNNITTANEALKFVNALEVEKGGRSYKLNPEKMTYGNPVLQNKQIRGTLTVSMILDRFQRIRNLSLEVWNKLLELNFRDNREFLIQHPSRWKKLIDQGNKVHSLQREISRSVNATPTDYRGQTIKVSIQASLIFELLIEPLMTTLLVRTTLYQKFAKFLSLYNFDSEVIKHVFSLLPQDRTLIDEVCTGLLANVTDLNIKKRVQQDLENFLGKPLEEETRPEALRILGKVYHEGILSTNRHNTTLAIGYYLSAAIRGDKESLQVLLVVQQQLLEPIKKLRDIETKIQSFKQKHPLMAIRYKSESQKISYTLFEFPNSKDFYVGTQFLGRKIEEDKLVVLKMSTGFHQLLGTQDIKTLSELEQLKDKYETTIANGFLEQTVFKGELSDEIAHDIMHEELRFLLVLDYGKENLIKIYESCCRMIQLIQRRMIQLGQNRPQYGLSDWDLKVADLAAVFLKRILSHPEIDIHLERETQKRMGDVALFYISKLKRSVDEEPSLEQKEKNMVIIFKALKCLFDNEFQEDLTLIQNASELDLKRRKMLTEKNLTNAQKEEIRVIEKVIDQLLLKAEFIKCLALENINSISCLDGTGVTLTEFRTILAKVKHM